VFQHALPGGARDWRFLGLCALLAGVASAQADAARLDPGTLKKVKQATVHLRVQLPDGNTAEGTGFLTDEPGLVLTNAHVLGMLAPESRRPERVDVTLNSGEPDSRTVPGRVLGVDRGTDLGLLRIDAKDLPPPLPLGSAKDLVETQEVFVFGFPFGQQLGKNITVSRSSVSSLRKSARGRIQQVQVNGGMHPGNSGGPVVDGDGKVIGVAVSAIKSTQINFAVPADYVHTFLMGRFSTLVTEPSYRRGKAVMVPILGELIDPLGRMKHVSLECWVSEEGPARPASDTDPAPLPGDSSKVTVDLTYDHKGIARGELALPPLPSPKHVYWLRPVVIDGAGEKHWLGVQPRRLPGPIDREAAMLEYKPPLGTEDRVLLGSQGSYKLRVNDGDEFAVALNLTALLNEGTEANLTPGGNSRVRFTFNRFNMVVRLNDKPVQQDEELKQIAHDVRFLAADAEVDADGSLRRMHTDLGQVPRATRIPLADIGQQILQSLEALTVPLPNDKLEPQQTWTSQRAFAIGSVGIVIPAVADIKYTYLGTREDDGKRVGVVGLRGSLRGQRGEGKNVAGSMTGSATVSLENGQVLTATTNVKVDMDLQLFRKPAKATGTLNVQLKRSASPPTDK
jgi:hypothetical protein